MQQLPGILTKLSLRSSALMTLITQGALKMPWLAVRAARRRPLANYNPVELATTLTLCAQRGVARGQAVTLLTKISSPPCVRSAASPAGSATRSIQRGSASMALLEAMLQYNPAHRITPAQALEHAYFKEAR